MPSRSACVSIALLVMLGVLTGCGDDELDRLPVTGTVRLDGERLEAGSIIFIPLSPTKGPKAAGVIENGRFVFTEADGPVSGRHKVQIFSDQATDYALDDPLAFADHSPESGLRERIAPEFNTETALEATISPGEDNVLSFDVSSTSSQPR